MKDLLGFEFFAYKDGAPLELDPDFGPEYSQLYKQKVAVLAQDIAQLLKVVADPADQASKSDDARSQGEPQAAEQTGGVSCRVQLRPKAAEGASRRGAQAPRLSGSAGQATAGRRDGICRGGGERCSRAARSRSISWAKNTAPSRMVRPTSRPACSRMKLAAGRCRASGLKRLIWLPRGTGSEDDRQRKFIEALHARRASSVWRGPDRGRHRGAEGRDPRHLEEDRAAGTEATRKSDAAG